MTDISVAATVDALDDSYDVVAEQAQVPPPAPPPEQSTVVPFPTPAAKPVNEFSLTPQPAAPVNEFSIEAIRQGAEQRTRASVLSAQGKSPDAAAKALELAKKTGVPPDVIEADPLPAQERVAINEFSASSPQVKQWLAADPYNARLTTDDTKALANLDTAIRKYKAMNTPSESADWEMTLNPQPGGFLFGPLDKPAPGAPFSLSQIQSGFEGAAASAVNAEMLATIRARQEIRDIEAGVKPVAGPKSTWRMMSPEDRAQAAQQMDAKIIRLAGQLKESKQYQGELPEDPAVTPFNNALDAVNASHFADTLLAALGNVGIALHGGDVPAAPANDAGAQQVRNVFAAFARDPLAILQQATLTNIPMLAGIVGAGAVAGPLGAGIAGFSMDFLSRLEDVTKQAIEDFRDTGDTGVDTRDPEAVAAFLQRNPDFIANAAARAGMGSVSIGLVDALTKNLTKPVTRARDLLTVAPANLAKAVTSEATGEAVARGVAGQPADLKEVVGEALGAIGVGAGHTIVESVQGVREGQAQEQQKAAVKQAGETITAATELLGDLQKRIAETGAVTLDDMVEKAAASKLATRSPDKLEEFMATVAPEQNVFVPAEAVRTLFQSMPQEDAAALVQSLGIADQLQEALASNGDVVIPLSKYVVELTRSKIHEAWRDDVRMQADGFSKRQADEDAKVREARLADFVKRAEAQIEAGIAEVDATTRVYEDFLAKAKTGGRFIDDAAKQYAALEAQRYATRAARNPDAFSDAWDAYSKAGLGTGVDVRSQLSERVGAYPPERLDVLLDSIRSGKVAPSQTDADAAAQFGKDREELTAALQGIDPKTMSNGQIRAALKADVTKRTEGATFEQPFKPAALVKFGQAIVRAISGTLRPNTLIPLGPTPEPLTLVGAPARGLAVPAGVVSKAAKDKHAVSTSTLQNLPILMQRPRAIYQSGTVPSAFVVAIEAKDENGNPVIVAVHTDGEQVNQVRSLYGKDDAARWFAEQEKLGRLVYEKTGRSPSGSAISGEGSRGLALPGADGRGGRTPTGERKVFSEADLVKGRTYEQSGIQTDTPAFKKWFGKSKVVDENGKPLVVYHGMKGDLEGNAFDPARIGETWAADERGFFFISNPKIASEYASGDTLGLSSAEPGAAVVPAYVALKKPLVIDDALLKSEGMAPIGETEDVISFWDNYQGLIHEWMDERKSDGVILIDNSTSPPTKMVVALRPQQIKSAVGNRGTFDPRSPNILRQEARGQISFAPDRATITLFQGRDLSTLLHESGHLWLEELGFDAKAANAPDQIKADYQAVLDWLGSTDGYITREQHETFARGFETYLMEGKAPSSELASAFRSFKNWLIQIYKRLTALGAPITPEIRAVFDRLIATDEQIATARTAQGLNPIFTDAKAMGVSQAVFDAYTRQANAVVDDAEQKLLQAKTEELRKLRTKEWRADEKLVREDVTNEVMSESGQQAFELLTKGAFPVGETPEVLKGVKISRETIVELYGDESVLALLPFGIWRDRASGPGTMSPDELATLLGLDSGRDLIERLMQLEAQRREMRAKGDTRSVATARIAEETAQRMAERYGDPLNDGTIEAEAQKAIHSDRQAALMATEMAMLARNAGHSGTVSWADIKGWAIDAIGGKAVRVATQSQQYLRNERQAGKRLEAALAKKDWVAALKAKQDQLVNLAMYQESVKAADEVESAVKLMNRYAGAATLKNMDQDYLEQIHAALENYEFKTRTDKLLAERKTFEQFKQEQEAQGVTVETPDHLVRGLGQKNYRDMTIDELRGLTDTVKQLAHLGRESKRVEVDGKKRERDAVLTDMEQTAAAGVQRGRNPSKRGKSEIEKAVGHARHMLSLGNVTLLKMERQLGFLDGRKDGQGIFTRTIFKPVAKAEDGKNDRRVELGKVQEGIYKRVPAEQRKRWSQRIALPELGGVRLTKEEVIGIALNMGNEQNLTKMLEGDKWTHAGVTAAVNRLLTKEEWRFVEDMWALLESQWPEFAAVNRDVRGVAPPKVEATPYMTPYGMVTGGYYPIAYDRNESLKGYKVGEKQDASLAIGMASTPIYGRASTKAGAANQRTQFSAPLDYSLSVIGKHLDEVTHDIFYARAVADIFKLISNDRFRVAVRSRLGVEYEAAFMPWLTQISREALNNNASLKFVDNMLRNARTNTTATAMGLRVSTVVQQLAGYPVSMAEVGAARMLKAIGAFALSPIQSTRAVRQLSAVMRNRANNLERDLKAAADKYRGKRSWRKSLVDMAFSGIAFMDNAVAVPTWMAGYEKGLAEGMTDGDAIYYGDKMVRDSQGAGGIKDLSPFQAHNSEAMKLMGMFGSFASVFYNAQAQMVEDFRTPGKSFSQWLQWTWSLSLWMVISPLMAAAISGQGPGDDEEPWWWAMNKVGYGAFAGIPIVRDIANTLSFMTSGKPSGGMKLSPIQGPIEASLQLTRDIQKSVSGEEPSKNMIKHFFNAQGLFTGLPGGGQVGTTAQFLYDTLTGEQSPQTALEWLRGLTYGPAK